jgi:hypothetical protein
MRENPTFVFCCNSVLQAAYTETAGETTGSQIVTAIIIAVVFLVGIVFATIMFVLLYKYRCMKVLTTM